MPLDVHAELTAVQAAYAPGPLRRWAYERLLAKLAQERARTRDPGERHTLSVVCQHVRQLVREEKG